MLHTTLTANGLDLELTVEGYEFPQFDTGWDANWLICHAKLDLVHHYGTIHAQHRLTILTTELAEFTRQLHAISHQLTGQATLQHTEDQIGLTVTLERGKGTIAGFLAAAAAPTTAKLSFQGIAIDQSYVPPLLSDLDAILAAYPPKRSR